MRWRVASLSSLFLTSFLALGFLPQTRFCVCRGTRCQGSAAGSTRCLVMPTGVQSPGHSRHCENVHARSAIAFANWLQRPFLLLARIRFGKRRNVSRRFCKKDVCILIDKPCEAFFVSHDTVPSRLQCGRSI